MPTFYPEAEIDIDPSDYIYECTDREIKELIQALVEDGHLPNHLNPNSIGNDKRNILDDEWDLVCEKIRTNRLNITNEEEEIVRQISKKF